MVWSERTRSWACSQGEKPGLLISRPDCFLIPLTGESAFAMKKLSECQTKGLVSPISEYKNCSHNLPVEENCRCPFSRLLMSLRQYRMTLSTVNWVKIIRITFIILIFSPTLY